MISEDDLKQYFEEDEWNDLSVSQKAMFMNFSMIIDVSSVNHVDCETKIDVDPTIKSESAEDISQIINSNLFDYHENLENIKILSDNSENINIPNNNNENILNSEPALNNVSIINRQQAAADLISCINCGRSYEKFCPNCPVLVRVFNSNIRRSTGRATLPKNILVIRNSTERAEGVFSLIAIPKGAVFGPYEGLEMQRGEFGCIWKLKAGKLVITEEENSSNWMQYVNSTKVASAHNLIVFQYEMDLYFQSSRAIEKDEELLLYYGIEYRYSEMAKNYSPMVNRLLDNVYACTVCCLGFRHELHLIKHKLECCHTSFNNGDTDEETVQCVFCKIYLNVKEYMEIHMSYCCEKHVRKCVLPQSDVSAIRKSSKFEKKRLLTKPAQIVKPKSKLCRRSNRLQSLCKSNKSAGFQEHAPPSSEKRKNTVDMKFNGIKVVNKKSTPHNVKFAETRVLRSRSKNGDVCVNGRSVREGILTSKTGRTVHRKHQLDEHENSAVETQHFVDTPESSVHQCKKCEFQTNLWQRFDNHLRYTHKIKDFFHCARCDYRTSLKSDFLCHFNKHPRVKKLLQCSKCDYMTSVKERLWMHEGQSHQVYHFRCDKCGEGFAKKDHMQRHSFTHKKNSQLKPFRCDACPKAFAYRSSLSAHQGVHTETKKYFKCRKCDYKTIFKSNLKEHVNNKHETGRTKKFTCSECDFSADQMFRLKRHAVTHGIFPFECDLCGQGFAQLSYLKYHLSRHENNPDTPFRCKCSLSFATKSGLSWHQTRMHPVPK